MQIVFISQHFWLMFTTTISHSHSSVAVEIVKTQRSNASWSILITKSTRNVILAMLVLRQRAQVCSNVAIGYHALVAYCGTNLC